MNTPLISVILPTYNAEHYIYDSIVSILNQTESRFELLILDDASTDETVNIIRSFTDSRIQLIPHQNNQKLVPLLNEGLDLAKGQFIARMDADDIATPQRFAKQVAWLSRHPEIDIVGTLVKYFGPSINKHWIQHYPEQHKDIYPGFLFHCMLCHPSVMFRRSFIEKNHLRFDENFIYAEDYEFWVRAAKYGKIATIQEPLLYYRKHNKQICSSQHEKQKILFTKIQSVLLREMGVVFTQQQIQLHEQLIANNYGENRIQILKSTLHWFQCILSANECSHYFDQTSLLHTLTKRWQRLFRSPFSPNLSSWLIHRNSPFYKVILKTPEMDPGSKNTHFINSLTGQIQQYL